MNAMSIGNRAQFILKSEAIWDTDSGFMLDPAADLTLYGRGAPRLLRHHDFEFLDRQRPHICRGFSARFAPLHSRPVGPALQDNTVKV